MKRITKKQMKIIAAADAPQFEEKLNDALAFLAEEGWKHEVTFNLGLGFVAYISYETEERIAENAKDRAEMNGCGRHFCGECPYFEKPDDKRVKWGTCTLTEDMNRTDTEACVSLFEAVEDGRFFWDADERRFKEVDWDAE